MTQLNSVCISPREYFVLEYSLASYLLCVPSHFWSTMFSCSAKAEILTFGIASGNLLSESSYSSSRLQLWLPHIFHWHLILLTATLMLELTFIRIMFILAYPLIKVCLPLYIKVLYELSVEFVFFFLFLYSSVFLHKLINFCFSITSVFVSIFSSVVLL